jgi:hypothetical protein
MRREIHIRSYFSVPTDLAAEMRDWPEFTSGEGYSVELRSVETGETVTVRFVEKDDDGPHVTVGSEDAGPLFDRVLGRVIYALSQHSDDLMVDRYV